MLLIANKKAITWTWGIVVPLTKGHWLIIVEEIFLMEKLIHILRLQEVQLEEKWGTLTYKIQNGDIETELHQPSIH